jgi:hypothetical protein
MGGMCPLPKTSGPSACPKKCWILIVPMLLCWIKGIRKGTGQEAPVWAQLQERADTFACPVYDVSKAMYFNGNDAVSLEKFTLIMSGYSLTCLQDMEPRHLQLQTIHCGAGQFQAWTDTPPHFTGEGLGITAEHTMVRKSDVANGVTVNPTVFNPLAEYDTLPANTFNHLGWHAFDGAPANETPVIANTNENLCSESLSDQRHRNYNH